MTGSWQPPQRPNAAPRAIENLEAAGTSAPQPEARVDRLFSGLLALVLLLSLLGRLYHVTAPYVDRFAWRSLDNASIARNFLLQGLDIRFPRVDWAGPDGLVETELPLLMYLLAWLYRLVGGELAWLGRLLSLACGTGLLWAFGRLSRAWLGPRPALLATFALAFLPTSLYFSRMFQQDSLMILAQVAALSVAWGWLGEGQERPTYPLWLAFWLALGALIKPTALLIGLPILVLALQRHGLAALRKPSLWLAFWLALIPPALWYHHARGLYLTSGYTFGIFSGGHDKFQWGRFLTQPAWYRELAERFATWHLTPVGLILVLLGLWALLRAFPAWPALEAQPAARPARLSPRGALLAWGITMLAFVPGVPEGNLDMHYYQWVCLPPLALIMGLGWDWLWQARGPRPWARARHWLGVALLLILPAYTAYFLRPAYGVVQTRQLELARAVQAVAPPGSLILAAGAYDVHNPGGYNYEPHIFYYSGHKGWGLLEDELTLATLEVYRARGADFLVFRDPKLADRHPAFMQQLRQTFPIARGDPAGLIFDMRRTP